MKENKIKKQHKQKRKQKLLPNPLRNVGDPLFHQQQIASIKDKNMASNKTSEN